jgi:hypothetical protein
VPVTWSINHTDRIVLGAAEGNVSLKDLEEYLSAIAAAGGLPYRKLFDTTYVAPGSLRLSELRAFSSRILGLAKEGTIGPIAIVVGSALEHEMAELFSQADAGRAIAIFSEVSKAQQWLDRLV